MKEKKITKEMHHYDVDPLRAWERHIEGMVARGDLPPSALVAVKRKPGHIKYHEDDCDEIWDDDFYDDYDDNNKHDNSNKNKK